MGFVSRLISPAFATPYRMTGATGKNDATDAEAICEAASRPHMRFVPAKTPEQQAWLAIHRLREGYIKERTACMNRARGILFEFGVPLPRSADRFHALLLEALSTGSRDLPGLAKTALRKCAAHFQEVQRQVAWCDQQIAKHVRVDVNAKAGDDGARRWATQRIGNRCKRRRSKSVRKRPPVRCVPRPRSEAAFHRGQAEVRADHQARRLVPAQAACHWCEKRPDHRAKAPGSCFAVGGPSARQNRMAEGQRRTGKQERSPTVAKAGETVRRRSCIGARLLVRFSLPASRKRGAVNHESSRQRARPNYCRAIPATCGIRSRTGAEPL